MEKRLFTSESVTEGHPDKMCDAISDAILDALMEKDPMSRVACETATTTGMVMVMGEITTKAYVDIPKIVRDTVREIGYTRAKYGFDADTCGVITTIDEQSADICVIHVHPVAVFQTDVSADLVIVQDVFFEEDFNANMHRSGSRAKQFDDLHFRHPHNGGIGRQIQSAVLVYPDDVSFFFHRWSF